MSSEEDKPPAPPVRLTSNRGGVGIERVPIPGCGAGDMPPVDMRPLPKGELVVQLLQRTLYDFALHSLIPFIYRAGRCRSQKEDVKEQKQRNETFAHGFQTKYIVSHKLWAHCACGIRCGHRRVYGEYLSEGCHVFNQILLLMLISRHCNHFDLWPKKSWIPRIVLLISWFATSIW